MTARKQALLKRHRRHKRLVLAVIAVVLLGCLALGPWWSAPLLALLVWLGHEAWFADHLFYSPRDNYSYQFPADTLVLGLHLQHGRLAAVELPPGELTLFLECRLKASWLGRLLDPQVRLRAGDDADRQDFERGVAGRRYVNLSGYAEALRRGELHLWTRFCRLQGELRLHVFAQPDLRSKRVMVIAPHADDAELAAFGLYSQAREASIVTLTQGEIEAGYYQRLGLDRQTAARLKGRLRTWDSLVTPLWGGVPTERCVQLGYYCLQLPAMRQAPEDAFGSRESGESDVRSARRHNPLQLPGDVDGAPTWRNLVADLVALLGHFRPEVVVLPHPQIDPHADHVASTQALREALTLSQWQPELELLYANHLHDNDRWPMGPAEGGIALPPAIETPAPLVPWSPLLTPERRLDKAMALGMQHDLLVPLPAKKRLRRAIQWLLAGRRWPRTGEDEFFRKAVRRHELFWLSRRDEL
ncbi:PIG-L deacetylase family protein [Pseudomonas oryzihabitans]|uniref:PIG-L deacetylase family protein n=1 Tax=Pseudomonas oryzihabitans TaxID=47885 RepID=UPI0015E2FD38|nr:PIG-L family deacetylase [Pseudomonas psychrotolerans]MBA1260506.1 PIG-L family deacetylase [Pseudomonas psychrotolerans]